MSEFDVLPKEPGLFILRVEGASVVPWSVDLYGQFYIGDAYLVYSAIEANQELLRDIYIWIGSEATQESYGIATIKAVEMVDFFNGSPIQYRELEGNESAKFVDLFNKHGGVRYLNGGVASGTKTISTKFQKRLYHIKGRSNASAKEVPVSGTSLNQGDAFVLITEKKYFLWLGKKANSYEKAKSRKILGFFIENRDAPYERLEDGDTSPEFWEELGGETPIAPDLGDDAGFEKQNVLIIYSYIDGKFLAVARGGYATEEVLKDNIFVLARGDFVVIWFPKGSPESKNVFTIGNKFLEHQGLDPRGSIYQAKEGIDSDELRIVLGKF